jgi:acyl-CoA thioester hydrolase
MVQVEGMSHRHEALAEFPVVVTIPVQWGDQDLFGHTNNVVYLRWCETARVEYLARVGLGMSLPPTGVGPILASIKCDYQRPLKYPDTVHVGARITRIGNSSLQIENCIVSESLGIVAATAESTIVMLDYTTNKTVRVSAEMRRIIGELEGKTFE